MQIFFLPKGLTIILCFILWPIFQYMAAFLCLKLPSQYLSPEGFLFRERRWERQGALYEQIFKIRRWKKYLPDGAAVTKDGYRKKHISDYKKENLERFLIESCRAELTHLLAILPFWLFGFFAPPMVIFYMFLYAIAINLPCIIAQRYNRPRIRKVLNRKLSIH